MRYVPRFFIMEEVSRESFGSEASLMFMVQQHQEQQDVTAPCDQERWSNQDTFALPDQGSAGPTPSSNLESGSGHHSELGRQENTLGWVGYCVPFTLLAEISRSFLSISSSTYL